MTVDRTRVHRALTVYAWAVLAFMVLVVLWGAVVRATGSGAGCGNHWPLCNGDFFPHHPRLATIIEFTHRSMSGFLTTLIAVLAAAVFYLKPKGHPARRASLWVVAFLISEALLGAVLVKGGFVEQNASAMRVFMQCIHFSNTMLLVAALTITAAWLSNAATETGTLNRTPLTSLTIVSAMLVGATGAVAALADTLFPSPSLRIAMTQDFSAAAPLMVRMRWIHPAATLVLFACLVVLYQRRRSAQTRTLIALFFMQALLGVLDVLLLAPTWMQVVHLLASNIFWIMLVIYAATAKEDGQTDRLAVPDTV